MLLTSAVSLTCSKAAQSDTSSTVILFSDTARDLPMATFLMFQRDSESFMAPRHSDAEGLGGHVSSLYGAIKTLRTEFYDFH